MTNNFHFRRLELLKQGCRRPGRWCMDNWNSSLPSWCGCCPPTASCPLKVILFRLFVRWRYTWEMASGKYLWVEGRRYLSHEWVTSRQVQSNLPEYLTMRGITVQSIHGMLNQDQTFRLTLQPGIPFGKVPIIVILVTYSVDRPTQSMAPSHTEFVRIFLGRSTVSLYYTKPLIRHSCFQWV